MMKGVRRGLGLLTVSGLLIAACEPEDYYIDNTNPDPVPCERVIDCYTNGNLEVGTDCINKQCLCHEPGEARLPCCKKGNPPDHCDRKCRQADQCADPQEPIGVDAGGGGDGAGGDGAGGDGDGGVLGGGCKSSTDCPAPEEPRCATAQCTNGACRIEFKPLGKLPSQIRGDCVSEYCDGAGKVATLPDGDDTYNDGRQCTIDACKDGMWVNTPLPDGTPCPETGLGACYQGECGSCYQVAPVFYVCGSGFECAASRCVPPHCTNGAFDPLDKETAEDCGGPCGPCDLGDACKVGADCLDGVCASGTCQPPSCSDGVINDGETGTDCGGPPSCPRCPPGQGCDFGSDCVSGVCWAGLCEEPRCDDGLKNGDELGVDCGGPCALCEDQH
jgi:hypothetical protein